MKLAQVKVPDKITLKPKGFRVLVYPMPIEEVSEGGIILHDNRSDRQKLAEQSIGILVAVGKTAWHAFDKKRGPNGEVIPGEPWAEVGEKVCYARHSGSFIEDPVTKEIFVLLNDEDISCGFEV